MLRRLTTQAMLAALATACGGGDATPSAEGFPVVDTIGGVVHVSHPASYQPALGWTIEGPVLEIGRLGGPQEEVFGAIGGVAVDAEGRVYVGDSQAMELRVFSSDGEFLFAFGRPGEGPGEFENIDALRLTPAGELLVRDVNQNRISVFGLDGVYRRQIRLDRPFLQYQARPTLWADTTGRIYDWLYIGGGGGVDTMGVAVYDDTGALARVIRTAAYSPERIRVMRGDMPVGALLMPLTPFPWAAVDRSGRIVVGVGSEYVLEVMDAAGRTLRRVTRDIESERAPGWLADTVTARIERFTGGNQGTTAEDYELPDVVPAYTFIFIDDAGYWWIARDGDLATLPTRYDIFDSTGRFLGQLELPPMRLMQIGRDFVAGVMYDELGVERVVVFKLNRNPRVEHPNTASQQENRRAAAHGPRRPRRGRARRLSEHAVDRPRGAAGRRHVARRRLPRICRGAGLDGDRRHRRARGERRLLAGAVRRRRSGNAQPPGLSSQHAAGVHRGDSPRPLIRSLLSWTWPIPAGSRARRAGCNRHIRHPISDEAT